MKNVIGVEQGSYCFIPSLKDCTFDRAMILVKNTRMSTWLTYYSSPKLHHKATISYFLREPTSTAQSKSYYSFSSISHCGRLRICTELSNGAVPAIQAIFKYVY